MRATAFLRYAYVRRFTRVARRRIHERVEISLNKSPLLVVFLIAVVIASIITAGLAVALRLAESAYSDLLSEFNEVSGRYEILLRSHDELSKRYDDVVQRYSWLDTTLKTKEVPSISQLELWLRSDKTDEYEYDPDDFSCFHFSVLLMLHGRARDYDLGVVALHGRSNNTGEPISHSINAIMTTEGLVYIEPQLDEVWWLNDHSEITNGTTYRFPMFEDLVYVTEISILFEYS